MDIIVGLLQAVCSALMNPTASPMHAMVAVYTLVFAVLLVSVAKPLIPPTRRARRPRHSARHGGGTR